MRANLLILTSILLGVMAQVIMKWGTMIQPVTNPPSPMLLRYLTTPQVLLGLGLYGVSAIFWIYALARVDLSYAYPMVALGYCLVFALSVYLFNEPLSGTRLLGLALIVAGVLVITRS